MEITKQKCKCKCDLNNCKNYADYYIASEGVIAARRFNICGECACKLGELLNSVTESRKRGQSEEK